MKILENAKFANAFNPADTNGAKTDGPGINVSDCGFATLVINIGNIAANASLFNVEESADNVTYTVVTGGSFASPTAADSDNKTFVAFVPCGGVRKKWLRATITGGAGATLIGGTWILEPISQSPNTTAERGAAETLFITA
jgi:hypothetical protein